MSFEDLRAYIHHLESRGQLARVNTPVDPNQEITIIQHLTMQQDGPALLFERVNGSPYRLVSNLFGKKERIQPVFGKPPEELGHMLAGLVEKLMPPAPAAVWRSRKDLFRIVKARLRNVKNGPVLQKLDAPARLDELPCLTCWPLDGGPFFTLPLVHTVDPENNRGNLGIYRMQRYDATSTGMHWQIEKGGAFHFSKACNMGRPLPVSVFLGGPPALTIAAIAPLPEGVDERILAALIMNRTLDLVRRETTGHRIPAYAEFVLEGQVRPGDLRLEGPFGDHLGHYSHSADFPVYRVDRVLHRRDPIFPATVVGKPPQEDFYLGAALQQMILPLAKLINPGLVDLWAYPETGFHPLAVMSVTERYPREALKHVFSILGQGQTSLTKVIIAVPEQVDPRDFLAVSQAVWKHLDAEDGLHLLAPTAQDTLDFTGPAMNTGSRLILLATQRDGKPLRTHQQPGLPNGSEVHEQIADLKNLGPAFLIVKLKSRIAIPEVCQALSLHPCTKSYLFHVLVSNDVNLEDSMSMLWGWFTRFDPLCDLHPHQVRQMGNRLIFGFPIAIDATWKPTYRKPVEFDPALERKVKDRWTSYSIPIKGTKT